MEAQGSEWVWATKIGDWIMENKKEFKELSAGDIIEVCKKANRECHFCQFGVKELGDNSCKCYFLWNEPDSWPEGLKVTI